MSDFTDKFLINCDPSEANRCAVTKDNIILDLFIF